MITISAFGLFFAGCRASFSTGNTVANTAKPANTASSPAASKDSNSTTAPFSQAGAKES